VTEGIPPDRADLVDEFGAPYVRPLGNLIILVAQAEAAWLKLVVGLTGCTEKKAPEFLDSTKVKQDLLPLVYRAGIEDGARQELCDSIDNFFCDRERRHRLIHDEWYVWLSEDPPEAVPMTRGLPRRKGAGVEHGEPKPEEIWDLALRFRDYRSVFSTASYQLREHNGP
jgi:hypothetical protein